MACNLQARPCRAPGTCVQMYVGTHDHVTMQRAEREAEKLLSQRCTVPHDYACRPVWTTPWKVHPFTAQNPVLNDLPLPWSEVIEEPIHLLRESAASADSVLLSSSGPLRFLSFGFFSAAANGTVILTICLASRSALPAGDKPFVLIGPHQC